MARRRALACADLDHARPLSRLRIAALTLIAMIAFAGNSILCRLALIDGAIDPAGFTSLRLGSAALTLAAIMALRGNVSGIGSGGSWASAITLIVYAIFFSYAYISLSAASGALILFGFVQATMIVAALLAGERPRVSECLGWSVAVFGLVWLLLPGVDAPPLPGAALMAIAGIGWGLYSLYGRLEAQPLVSTTGNFLRVLLPVAILTLANIGRFEITSTGILLACLSGCLTTGVGYVIWYAALPGLSSLQAALVQLSVPAIAALGGVLFIGEAISTRLLLSGLLIIGGICVALGGKYYRPTMKSET